MKTIKNKPHAASPNGRGVIESIVCASLALVIAFGLVASASAESRVFKVVENSDWRFSQKLTLPDFPHDSKLLAHVHVIPKGGHGAGHATGGLNLSTHHNLIVSNSFRNPRFGGCCMENMHYWPDWDVMGGWTTRAVEVEDWMDVPLAGSRERKIPLSNATSAWGYYGVPPESPDGKRLCYAVYPEQIDLSRKERSPVYPAQLWVCNMDGTGHRMLFKVRNDVHNGLEQSWVDNTRIVFASGGATCIVNADTGKMDFGPFEGFIPAHFAMGGKVLMHNTHADSAGQRGLHEFDTATGKRRLVLPYTKSIHHAQYSPDGRKALFTTNGNTNLAVVNLDGTDLKVLPGKKPMHFQWFDDQSFFGYAHGGVVGVDLNKHRNNELYRWNLDGKVIEHLAGHGCHGAARRDGKYFVGESWYGSNPIVLRLYSRGQRKPLTTIFSHSFFHVTWLDGGRHHVNPSFSRDGARVYYNKAVNENTSQAFCYDLTGLVEPMK